MHREIIYETLAMSVCILMLHVTEWFMPCYLLSRDNTPVARGRWKPESELSEKEKAAR